LAKPIAAQLATFNQERLPDLKAQYLQPIAQVNREAQDVGKV